MIAEKILEQFDPNEEYDEYYHQTHILAAMTSYADFYYWLGKEGWVRYEGEADLWHESLRVSKPKTESDLYDQYIKTKV